MPTDIKLKNSVTATNAPTSLQQGEVAINITDKKVWVGNAATTPILLVNGGPDGIFTSITDSGNLTFTGTGNRITGDFSNATIANRVGFQTSTTNGVTAVAAYPNGTATTSAFHAYNNSDPTNSGFCALNMSSTEVQIASAIRGTGTYLPMAFLTGGSERMRIDTSGQLGIGTSSPGYRLDVAAGDTTAGLGYAARLRSNSTAGAASLQFTNNGVTAQNAYITADDSQNLTLASGTGYTRLWTNGSEKMRIDSSGNVGIGTSSPVSGKALTLNSSNNYFGINFQVGGTQIAQLQQESTGILYVDSNMNNQGGGGTVFRTNGTERMRIDSSGNLLVGTTSVGGVGWSLYGTGNLGYGVTKRSGTGSQAHISFQNDNGQVGYILTSGSSTTYSTSSDYRLKDNIAPMAGALATVSALKPVTYKWKADGSNGQGFIAHELQEIVPDCVSGEKDAVDAEGKPVYQGVDTSFLVATLTAAIQEQQTIINELKTRIEALESK